MDGLQLKHTSEFKYLGFLDKSGTDDADWVGTGRKVAEVYISGKHGDWCMIGMNGGSL